MTGPGLDNVYGVMIKRELSSWLSREYQANARSDAACTVDIDTVQFDLPSAVQLCYSKCLWNLNCNAKASREVCVCA